MENAVAVLNLTRSWIRSQRHFVDQLISTSRVKPPPSRTRTHPRQSAPSRPARQSGSRSTYRRRRTRCEMTLRERERVVRGGGRGVRRGAAGYLQTGGSPGAAQCGPQSSINTPSLLPPERVRSGAAAAAAAAAASSSTRRFRSDAFSIRSLAGSGGGGRRRLGRAAQTSQRRRWDGKIWRPRLLRQDHRIPSGDSKRRGLRRGHARPRAHPGQAAWGAGAGPPHRAGSCCFVGQEAKRACPVAGRRRRRLPDRR